MIDDFILRALLAGFGISAVCGAMGCFVVWRRMAYFGDSIAHSSLLGIAVGLATGLSRSLMVMAISIVFALLLLVLQNRRTLSTDTLLGILAHAALSGGIVLLSLLNVPVDLHSLLFGDILTITAGDLILLLGGGIVVLGVLSRLWTPLLLMTVDEDLAKAEGIKTLRIQMGFLMLMVITIAVSVQIIGLLLITSMLIIPAATAREIATTPRTMAIFAIIISSVATSVGIALSLLADIPTGPSIVVSLAASFALFACFTSAAKALR